MALFILNHHDSSREAVRELARTEIDAVFGANGNHATIGEPGGPGDCDQTICETMLVTPNGDGGDISSDCDVG
ncbi:MAG: hypothetical protein RIA71_05910 [Oceanicaulis sp.]